MEFNVIQGDITEQQADALVNAADTALRMGGGVAGALKDAAGEGIKDEADKQSPVGLGDAVETGSYQLNADYVIHAATMEPGGVATESTIRGATRNALATVDDLDCKSVVLPALGCGIAGVDLDDGARFIFEEVLDFQPETVTDVRVIAYDRDSYRTLKQVARDVRYQRYWGDKQWDDLGWKDSVLQFGLPAVVWSGDEVKAETEILFSEVMRIDSEIDVEVGDVIKYKNRDSRRYEIEERQPRPDSGYTAYQVRDLDEKQ